jgi:predicted RNA-binding Zn-ribbon protein involved in translation (DUF1610 family)
MSTIKSEIAENIVISEDGKTVEGYCPVCKALVKTDNIYLHKPCPNCQNIVLIFHI